MPEEPSVSERLFDRRVLFLHGELDDATAGDLALALMTLDAAGDEPVTLHVDSSGGTLDGALAVIDTVDLLGVPVQATCSGLVAGAAVGVVAACARRRATANARVRLEAPPASFQGSTGSAEEWLRQHRERLERFTARLAEATGQSRELVRADLEEVRALSPPEAVRYGLIDEIIGPLEAGSPPPDAPTPLPVRGPRLG